jgi:hypothetical protein
MKCDDNSGVLKRASSVFKTKIVDRRNFIAGQDDLEPPVHDCRTAMSGVSDAYLIGKPFIDDELANKVRNALAGGEMGNVVRP